MRWPKGRYQYLGWMGSLRILIRALTFLRLAILARILTPQEFGLFGLAAMALALMETLTETGVNVFFIQKEGAIKEYADSAFAVSLLRGILIALVLVLFAGPISLFFQTPAASTLIYWVAVVALMRGLINPAVVSFQKNLDFAKEFGLRSLTAVVDVVVSILIAQQTRSALGLVAGMGAAAVVEVCFTQLALKPRPRFNFKIDQITHVLKRGSWVTLAGIFQYLFSNLDNMVVGRLLGIGALGYYQNAYRIASLPITEISDVVSKVSFPHYAEVATQKLKLSTEFKKYSKIVITLTSIFTVLLLIWTKQIVGLLLGSNWLEIVPAVRILSVFAWLRGLQGTLPPLWLATKRQEWVTRLTAVSLVGLAVLVWPLSRVWGIEGTSMAVLGAVILASPYLFYAYRISQKELF